jgi:adenosine deaminase
LTRKAEYTQSGDSTHTFGSWPKIELHRHLPGAIRFETWWDIVTTNRIRLPTGDPEELRRLMTVTGQLGLKEFLNCFHTIDLCFVDAGALERLTYEAIADAARENIIYLELRFGPTRMARRAHISTPEVLDAVIAGRRRAERDFGMDVGLIAGLSREMGVETCAAEAEVIAGYAGQGIDGMDLLGNEADFPADWFAPVFEPIARRGRLGITVHAGEGAGPESVVAAILRLGAVRIGHGIRAQEDPAVLELIRERGVILEMCPTSNFHTGAITDLSHHPLPRFMRSGIKVTINTDDPQVSGIDLAHEYRVAASVLGLSKEEILRTLDDAVDGAFASDEVKSRNRKKLGQTRGKER